VLTPSDTPLLKKLGIKEGYQIALVSLPPGFELELGPLPADVAIVGGSKKPLDLVLVFAESRSELERRLATVSARLSPSGMIWAAWPKRSSGVSTDLSFEAVQSAGLAAGLVDTKICALNETWSALRFVVRLKDRPQP
jgi:hypothetical protein